MMSVTIENDNLRVVINPKGAELDSVFHKHHQLEYLWQGDAAFWGKKSPVLFPIVGTLKDNSFIYGGKTYHLPRHGFARDRVFDLEKQTATEAVFLLKSDAESLKVYPFDFEFRLHYTLIDNSLRVGYDVKNTTSGDMYFSVGGHPAFRVPLVERMVYTDYFITLDQAETVGRYPLSKEGLLELETNPFLENEDTIPLKSSLFYADAVVLKHLKSDKMTIRSEKTTYGLSMTFAGFPFFGIWAAKDAPFVCLEPWCGVADSVNVSQRLEEKEGIVKLEQGEQMIKTWSIDIF
ncbi:MAG: aldose 1-epimerase family protein [Saprospiraceae bacterium]|nr:aldose 1-epimerase family protein [Saprospiraceae bacterium]